MRRSRNKRSPIRKKLTGMRNAGKDIAISGLAFIPGVGTALSIYDTARKMKKLARTTSDCGRAIKAETKRRIRRIKKQIPF